MRVIYVGSDLLGSCLTYIVRQPDLELVLMAVDSLELPSSQMLLEVARHLGVEVVSGVPDSAWVEQLNGVAADVLICAAYKYRIPVAQLSVPVAINVHPSLLPLGRGPSPWSHVNEQRESAGITIHILSERLDEGDVVLQTALPSNEISDSLSAQLVSQAVAPLLLAEFLGDPDRHLRSRRPQGLGTYFGWPTAGERSFQAAISTVDDVERLFKRFGSLSCQCYLANGSHESVVLWRALRCQTAHPPGRLVRWSSAEVVVALVDGLGLFHRMPA